MRWDSSTSVAISSGVSCAGSGSSSSTERAPVVITLTKSAPRRSCSRTARRTSSQPSASRYMPAKKRPPGAVADTIRPQVSSRGPRKAPWRIAWRASTTSSPKEPTSRTVVIPMRSIVAQRGRDEVGGHATEQRLGARVRHGQVGP